jgi:hypothetical protein
MMIVLRIWACLNIAASFALWCYGFLPWGVTLAAALPCWVAYVEAERLRAVRWVADV